MYCFFFGLFITLEQVNDYVLILEYQGEINICIIFALRHMTFCLELWKAKCAIFCLLSCFLSYVQWTRVFSGLTVTFVTKTDTNVL